MAGVNHMSNLCKDHNNKSNILPWFAEPTVLFKFSRTKANSVVNLDVYIAYTFTDAVTDCMSMFVER
jgi:hypothetical protein